MRAKCRPRPATLTAPVTDGPQLRPHGGERARACGVPRGLGGVVVMAAAAGAFPFSRLLRDHCLGAGEQADKGPGVFVTRSRMHCRLNRRDSHGYSAVPLGRAPVGSTVVSTISVVGVPSSAASGRPGPGACGVAL